MRRHPKFAEVYAEYASFVWKMARFLHVPPERIDDVVQEVWIDVARKLDTLDLSRSLKPWLVKVLLNHARRARRTFARVQRKMQALEYFEAAAATGRVDPVSARDAGWMLEQLLTSLPEEQRVVFLLCEGEGHSAPEVSEALGVELNTVYSRLRLARHRCQRMAATLGVAGWALLLRQYCERLGPSPDELARVAAALEGMPDLFAPTLEVARGAGATNLRPLVYLVSSVVAGLAIALTVVSLGGAPVESVSAPELPGRARETGSEEAPRKPPQVPPPPALPPPPSPPTPLLMRREPLQRGSEPRSKTPSVAEPWGTSAPLRRSIAAGLTLLREAEDALSAGNTSEALRKLSEHRHDFPDSSADTRDLLRIRVHCARRDPESARKIAAEHRGDAEFSALLREPCPALSKD